jgi:hypothetical protein
MARDSINCASITSGLSPVGLACLALSASCLGACALEPDESALPPTAEIDVVLTPVNEFGSTTTLLSTSGEGAQLGYAAAVAAAGGYVFVVDSAASGLVQLNAARGEMRLLHTLQDANTTGLYVTTDLIIYVVDRFNRAVLELSETGWERRTYEDDKLIPAPVDVTQTNWGATVLVADELTQRMAMFDSLSNPTGLFTTTLSPVAIAASINAIASTDAFVFVLDAASREVTQLDLYGRVVGTYGEDSLLAPVALAVDECRRMFVADGHPDGLFVSSPDSLGMSARAALPSEITMAVTDLWIEGSFLYIAAGTFGVHVMAIEPACMTL